MAQQGQSEDKQQLEEAAFRMTEFFDPQILTEHADPDFLERLNTPVGKLTFVPYKTSNNKKKKKRPQSMA